MNVNEVLLARKSIRSFLKKDVDLSIIKGILNHARWAPSGANTQPWQVAIVTGNKKKEIEQQMIDAFQKGSKEKKDYDYYPVKWQHPYIERRLATGMQLYEVLSIGRVDVQKRKMQWMENYKAFGAPMVLYFFLDPGLAMGSFLDYGMFLQSFMLSALEAGLATCPQAALAEYPSIVKRNLAYPGDSILLCGMAIGYEDKDAKINSYRTPREDVDKFIKYFD